MTKMIPFRMIGNLYFVGTREASCHMIDTGDGLILIDTGCEENAETVTESVTALGFDMRDVKIILHSHGHYDHSDATAKLLKLTPNAKTYLSRHNVEKEGNGALGVSGGKQTFYPSVAEGDLVTVANVKIGCEAFDIFHVVP